jgi:hypothetical protein
MDTNKYLTLEDAASELNITPLELKTMYNAGKIDGDINLDNGTIEFLKSEIEACKQRLTQIRDEIRGGINSVLEEEGLLRDDSDLLLSDESGIRLDGDLSLGVDYDQRSSVNLGVEPKNTQQSDQSMARSALNDDDDDLVLDYDDVRYDANWDRSDKNSSNSGFDLESPDSGINLEADDSAIWFDSNDSGIQLDADDSGIKLDADGSGIELDTPDSDEDNKNEIELIEVEELSFDDLDDNEDSSNSDININFIDPARYYSLEDAARYLGIHTSELIDLREGGQIRGFPEGDTLEFRGSDLIELKNKRNDKPFFSESDEDGEDQGPVIVELEDSSEFPNAHDSKSNNTNNTGQQNNPDDELIRLESDTENSEDNNDPAEDPKNNPDVEKSVWQNIKHWFTRQLKQKKKAEGAETAENEPEDSTAITNEADSTEDGEANAPKTLWGKVKHWFTRQLKQTKKAEGTETAENRNKIDIKPVILLDPNQQHRTTSELAKNMAQKKEDDLQTINNLTERAAVAQAIDDCNTFYLENQLISKHFSILAKKTLSPSEKAEAKKALERYNKAMHRVVHTYSNYLDPYIPPALDTPEEQALLVPRMEWIIGKIQDMHSSKALYTLGRKVGVNGKNQEAFIKELLNRAQAALKLYNKE